MLVAGQLSNGCHQQGRSRDNSYKNMCDSSVANEEYRSKWYVSRKDLETNSPSRKDGIDWMREDQLRAKYCSLIQNLGMELKVPQLTIATSIMFCHRFYLRQSHSKNNWQIVASVCMFLASKVEETPCLLDKVVVVAYKMMHREDSSAAQRIHLKEVFAKQKELMLIGERLLLATLGFDLNIQHPYKPLVAALKKLRLQNDLMKIAWNFVNDWLRTTLCLQYKPHYIAAGSLYLAAKVNNVELPSQRESVWWQEFDVMPRQLREVVQHMMQQIGFKRTSAAPCTQGMASASPLPIKERTSSTPLACAQGKTTDTPLSAKEASSPDSVLSQGGSDSLGPPFKQLPGDGSNQNGSSGPLKACSNIVNKKVESQSQQFEGPNGMVVDSEDVSGRVVNASAETRRATSNEAVTTIVGLDKLDRERIRAKLKRRRWDRENKKVTMTDDSIEDSWVREIESGIELGTPNRRVAKLDC